MDLDRSESPWDVLRATTEELEHTKAKLRASRMAFSRLADRFNLHSFFRGGLDSYQSTIALYVARQIIEDAEEDEERLVRDA